MRLNPIYAVLVLMPGCATFERGHDPFLEDQKQTIAQSLEKALEKPKQKSELFTIFFNYDYPLHAPAGYVVTMVNEYLRWSLISDIPTATLESSFIEIRPGRYTAFTVLNEVGKQVPWQLTVDEKSRMIRIKPASFKFSTPSKTEEINGQWIVAAGYRTMESAKKQQIIAEKIMQRPSVIKTETYGSLEIYVIAFQSNDPKADIALLKQSPNFRNARLFKH